MPASLIQSRTLSLLSLPSLSCTRILHSSRSLPRLSPHQSSPLIAHAAIRVARFTSSSPSKRAAMAPPASPSRQAKLTSKGSIAKPENGGGSGPSSGKRPRPDGTDVPPEAKKAKANSTHKAFPANPPEPNEVGGEDNGTILEKLEEELEAARKGASTSSSSPQKGGCVLYWMRMKDIRLRDNKALSLASSKAKELGQPLVILHVFSPGDYKAHDRSPVRIDWVLRNLRLVQVCPLPQVSQTSGHTKYRTHRRKSSTPSTSLWPSGQSRSARRYHKRC